MDPVQGHLTGTHLSGNARKKASDSGESAAAHEAEALTDSFSGTVPAGDEASPAKNPSIKPGGSSNATVSGASELFRDRSIKGSLHHLWDCDIPGKISSEMLLLKEGTLLCGTGEGNLLSVRDGHTQWELKLGETSLTTPALGPDGTIFVSGKHSVYAVKDGKIASECAINDGEESISRPAVGPDGTVYVTTSPGKLYAIKNGKVKWSYRPRSIFNRRENSTWSDPSVGPDGTVYAGTASGKILALADGKELWRFKMEKMPQETMTGDDYYNVNDKAICAPILGPDGVLYVGTEYGMLYALQGGKKLWSSRITDNMRALNLGSDGLLYSIGSSFLSTRFEQSLCAISRGEIKWSYHTENNYPSISSRGVTPDGKVLLGTHKHIYAVKDGKRIGDIYKDQSDDSITQRPLIDQDGNFYFVRNNSTIKAYTFKERGESDEAASVTITGMGIGKDDNWLLIDDVRLPLRNDGTIQR